MTKEQLEARICELDAQISRLDDERIAARQQLAEMQTDLKVGDRVTYDGAKYVWEIQEIRPGYGKEPKFYGARIKKDGTPGKNFGEIWSWPYDMKLVKVNAP